MRISDWSSDVCSSDLYVVSPAMATGNRWSAAGDSTAGDSTAGDSTAGEGRLVVAGLAVLVDAVGALVVLLFAVVVRLLRNLLVVVIVFVAFAPVRLAGLGADAADGRPQPAPSAPKQK